MKQRGRKSRTARDVENIVDIRVQFRKPAPPPELSPEAKETWNLTVDALKPDFFRGESLKLLEAYCRAIALGNRLFRALEVADIRDLRQYTRIHSATIRQTNLILSLATKLRITPQSSRSAAATKHDPAPGPRPWDRDDEPPPTSRKPWD